MPQKGECQSKMLDNSILIRDWDMIFKGHNLRPLDREINNRGQGDNETWHPFRNTGNDHVDEEDKTLLSYNGFKVYRNGDLKNMIRSVGSKSLP